MKKNPKPEGISYHARVFWLNRSGILMLFVIGVKVLPNGAWRYQGSTPCEKP